MAQIVWSDRVSKVISEATQNLQQRADQSATLHGVDPNSVSMELTTSILLYYLLAVSGTGVRKRLSRYMSPNQFDALMHELEAHALGFGAPGGGTPKGDEDETDSAN